MIRLLPVLLLAPQLAHGSVCSNNVVRDLTCEGVGWSGVLRQFEPDRLDDWGCLTYSQPSPEDIYRFVCPYTGPITVRLHNLDCDVDIIVLDDTCDLDTGCVTWEVDSSYNDPQGYFADFDCIDGEVYYVVVEGYDPGRSSGNCPLDFSPFGLFSDYSVFAYCDEFCEDGADNDGDGDVDCEDDDCPSCGEDCTTPGDEDGNGLADCDDPVCAGAGTCCDLDGDGWLADTPDCGMGGDCADQNPNRHPGIEEVVANGFDEDCDGVDDCWRDADHDGWGAAVAIDGDDLDCTNLLGETAQPGDCDDALPSVYPGAAETVADGIDQDCNGGDLCFVDGDGDGFGTAVTASDDDLVCGNGDSLSASDEDCLDIGVFGPSTFPGADERCDGRDNDCDLLADDADDDTVDPTNAWPDTDGDTWGAVGAEVAACAVPSGWVLRGGDCDDGRLAVHPGAAEVCDELDNDCNELVDTDDPGVDAELTAFPDTDGDGFGAMVAPTVLTSCVLPDAWSPTDTDCNDALPEVNPAASEIPYDGIDQDCQDGDLNDQDGDGSPGGVTGTDCHDTDPSIHPGAIETADGVDQDCDGTVDDGTVYGDDDGDGVTETGGDCNDADPSRHPGAPEICDGADQDCDGIADEGTNCVDDDLDGFTELQGDCNDADPSIHPAATELGHNGIDDDCDALLDPDEADTDGDGFGLSGGDCNDTNATVSPGAPEQANGVDDDCDGIVDEGTVAGDDDGDGVTEVGGDCDDSAHDVHPGATEDPTNRRDDDCDGVVDEGGLFVDDDGDGFSDDEGDCNDDDPSVYPYAPERQNDVDDDCDGQVDEQADDLDGDGWSTADGDCDDSQGWANPEGTEVCDGIDNDCDGQVDENCLGRTSDDDAVEPEPGGCACSGGGGGPWWLATTLLLGRRKRSRSRAA